MGDRKMRYKEIIAENSGIDFDMQFDDDTGSFAKLTARAQGRVLGSVKFFVDGDTLIADQLEVDERYRGQGIAAAMYDYAKSQGYTVEKSDDLTPDGEHFWHKNRGEQAVWEGVNDPHIFKCIFLFGPMGAGKSTVAGPLLSHTGLRSVNLDNFNEMFIKKGQVPTGHLAPDQLEKSWQLSQTQQNNFADARLGVIIDGSGRSTETAIGVLGKLAPLGYEFMMIFVNVSEATSIARQQSRAAKQQQQWGVGRQVDPTLAKNTYDQVQKNLGKYSAFFGPDRFVYVDNENTPDLTQATKKVDAFLRAPVTRPEALAWIQTQKGGQQVAQQQQKLATAQGRQQQALKQYNPLNPKFAKQGMAEDAEPVDREFHLVKKLGRLGERIVQNPKLWNKYSEAIDNDNIDWIIGLIQEVVGATRDEVMHLSELFGEIGGGLGRIVDFAWAVKEGKWEQDFMNPYRQYRSQGMAEGSLGNVLPWPEVVNKVNSAMKAMGWKGQRRDDGSFMFSTRGAETDDQYYIVIIDNEGDSMFTYALGTVEDGSPDIGEQDTLPTTEASVSELMNAIRDGFGLNENFHDGRNPQDKGDSKRHGVPTKASISTLRKVAKQGGRKGQLAHWMANMKSGRAKAKRK
jgi:adenylate kinase family enzyme/GNAT superfamily N-acetyltransferase